MVEPLKKSENTPQNANEARRAAEQYRRESPTGSENEDGKSESGTDQGLDTERSGASLNQDIRAQINHPHKGDVGRPGTNEEVFQGSKQKELKAS